MENNWNALYKYSVYGYIAHVLTIRVNCLSRDRGSDKADRLVRARGGASPTSISPARNTGNSHEAC